MGSSPVARPGSLVSHGTPFWISEISPGGMTVRCSHEDSEVSWGGFDFSLGTLGLGGPGQRCRGWHRGTAMAGRAAAVGARPGAARLQSGSVGRQMLPVQKQRWVPGCGASLRVRRRGGGGTAGGPCPCARENGTTAPPVLWGSCLTYARRLRPEAEKPWTSEIRHWVDCLGPLLPLGLGGPVA